MADEKIKKTKKTAEETNITFSPEQIKLIDKMMNERTEALKNSMARPDSPNAPLSLYNMRDIKSIDTVNVSRFDAKWVIGFKNLQNDPYKKKPKYLRYGVEPIRKLFNEPFVTLLLSKDGKESAIQNVELDIFGTKIWVEEKEVLLLDYMENREKLPIKVLEGKVKTVIHDHGILGRTGQFAVAIDDKGKPESRPTIMAQSKSEERSFVVKLEEFDEPIEFISDFLG